MLRVALIGPGDVESHFKDLLGIDADSRTEHIDELADALDTKNVELLLLPDRGISFELAKAYKRRGGRIIGVYPKGDQDFGTGHLTPYLEAQLEGRPLYDALIDSGTWFRQDLLHCTFADRVLVLGASLGSLGELAYGYYLLKLFTRQKAGVEAARKCIHDEIRAGSSVPFETVAYRPFLKGGLGAELEWYIGRVGGALRYAADAREAAALLQPR